LNNNKLINEKLICAFRWSVLPSIMKMHGPKNKKIRQFSLYSNAKSVFEIFFQGYELCSPWLNLGP